MVNMSNWKHVVRGNDGELTSTLLPCHARVYSFPIISDNRYSFHVFSMAVSSYTQDLANLLVGY
jgi:hypothetical protein